MVYVVDDDYDVRTSLRFLLETEGFDVRTFRNGTALLGSSTRHRADCLVVDYKMAEIDGLELAHRLRGLNVRTPIVLITGYPDENISAKANSAGGSAGAFEAEPGNESGRLRPKRDQYPPGGKSGLEHGPPP